MINETLTVDQLIAETSRRVMAGLDVRPQPERRRDLATPSPGNIAAIIDHTLLKPEATADQVRVLCEEAQSYGFASVCINPGYVDLVAGILAGSGVPVCTVAGFPLGATPPEVKAFETRRSIDHGASEIDMVLNIGALKNADYQAVYDDVYAVVAAARPSGAIVKVIIETCLLTDEEKVAACVLSVAAGVDFVKTSTGFSTGGATVADVALMRRTVGPAVGVKAAGGIRTYADAQAMIAAGASRIGSSAGVRIVQEAGKG
jgi:deoxyribose-phosphate aldolase